MDNRMFEWDEDKNKENIKKHGISFELASLVFTDENRIEKYDESHSTAEEERWNAIGMINHVVFVVYTIVKENTTRIISARFATKEEKYEYYSLSNS